MKYGILLALLLGQAFCSNYTTTKSKPVPPILISLKAIPTGHLLTMRSSNPEIFFAGYRLFPGNSENAARNPGDLNGGIDCSGINLLPNLPLEYSIEISPNPGGLAPVEEGDNPNRVCKMNASLGSGSFVSVRALILSFQVGGGSFTLSAPSNALVVP
jgi:hypothetical protein